VERDPRLDRLSEAHQLALRLDVAGADHGVIARMLDIEPEAVGPLLDVAQRKARTSTARPDHEAVTDD
jgi:hypothetical protein